jgi:hypothetical protein
VAIGLLDDGGGKGLFGLVHDRVGLRLLVEIISPAIPDNPNTTRTTRESTILFMVLRFED